MTRSEEQFQTCGLSQCSQPFPMLPGASVIINTLWGLNHMPGHPTSAVFVPYWSLTTKKWGKKMKILHILANKFFHMRVCIHSPDHTTYATTLSDKWSCSQDWGVQIMFFAMISKRFLCHLYTVIWKYRLHNDFQEIL